MVKSSLIIQSYNKTGTLRQYLSLKYDLQQKSKAGSLLETIIAVLACTLVDY